MKRAWPSLASEKSHSFFLFVFCLFFMGKEGEREKKKKEKRKKRRLGARSGILGRRRRLRPKTVRSRKPSKSPYHVNSECSMCLEETRCLPRLKGGVGTGQPGSTMTPTAAAAAPSCEPRRAYARESARAMREMIVIAIVTIIIIRQPLVTMIDSVYAFSLSLSFRPRAEPLAHTPWMDLSGLPLRVSLL